jgi:DNA-binding GntR family transcriptional regulator
MIRARHAPPDAPTLTAGPVVGILSMVSMEAQAEPHAGLKVELDAALRAGGASVADAVFRTLRQAIVTMRLAPGTRLTEQELADGLSVSRQPVREALLRLREAHLVQVLPRGSFVARIVMEDVETAQFVREAVETAIAARAGAGVSALDLARLGDLVERQKRVIASGDNDAFFHLDEAFHRTLAEAAGCAPAWRTIEGVKAHMDRVRYLSLPEATPGERLIAQHEAILAGLVARDASASAEAMGAHLREILSSLPRLAARHPKLFEGEARVRPV